MAQSPERKKEYAKEYYEKNRDHLSQQRKVWRDSHKDRQAEYRRKKNERRQAIVRELKSIPCMDCGVTFPPCCMDFDHRLGEEKHWRMTHRKVNGIPRAPASFSTLCYTSLKVFREEIKKCDVICSNCHRVRTWERRTR